MSLGTDAKTRKLFLQKELSKEQTARVIDIAKAYEGVRFGEFYRPFLLKLDEAESISSKAKEVVAKNLGISPDIIVPSTGFALPNMDLFVRTGAGHVCGVYLDLKGKSGQEIVGLGFGVGGFKSHHWNVVHLVNSEFREDNKTYKLSDSYILEITDLGDDFYSDDERFREERQAFRGVQLGLVEKLKGL